MTKNEALKAAIDGKRISHKSWDSKFYITWDGSLFRTENGETYYFNHACLIDWQIVPDTVDFATAWKAWDRERKTIKSLSSQNVFNKGSNKCSAIFDAQEIRGQWIILEDL